MKQDGWDLIVVGAGSAGMVCAITAAEQGAMVLAVEKTAEVGGTLHVSGGHMSAAGSRRQNAFGIDDSPYRHFEEVMHLSRGTADPKLVRLAVEEAPHTIDWLEELGFEFAEHTPTLVYGHEPYEVARTHWGVDAGKSILAVLRPLWDELVAIRKITVLLEHSLTGLLYEDGRVTGVRVQGPEGKTADFRGRAVALTTGGYAANPQLFAELTPGAPKLVSTARSSSTGDGIQVARQLGASVRGGEKFLGSLGGIELEPGRADFWTAWAVIQSGRSRPPREIYVNSSGERFTAEDSPGPDPRERALLEQPEHKLWVVFDEASIEAGLPLVRQWNGEELRAKTSEGKVAWVADTIEELAQKAGINPAGLQRTVQAFNQAVVEGYDPLGRTDLSFPVKQPPFYALLTHATSLISFGGLAVDEELRVLDEAGQPIPGLYAAGEIVGAGATSGNAFCGGMLLTPALSFGRILGQKLAQAGPKAELQIASQKAG